MSTFWTVFYELIKWLAFFILIGSLGQIVTLLAASANSNDKRLVEILKEIKRIKK